MRRSRPSPKRLQEVSASECSAVLPTRRALQEKLIGGRKLSEYSCISLQIRPAREAELEKEREEEGSEDWLAENLNRVTVSTAKMRKRKCMFSSSRGAIPIAGATILWRCRHVSRVCLCHPKKSTVSQSSDEVEKKERRSFTTQQPRSSQEQDFCFVLCPAFSYSPHKEQIVLGLPSRKEKRQPGRRLVGEDRRSARSASKIKQIHSSQARYF